jgi:hypothetical protein
MSLVHTAPLEANARSIEVRRRRAELAAEIRRGAESLAAVIGDPPPEVGTMRVFALLERTIAGRLDYRRQRIAMLNMAAAANGVNLMHRLGDLTVRERLWLIDHLPDTRRRDMRLRDRSVA